MRCWEISVWMPGRWHAPPGGRGEMRRKTGQDADDAEGAHLRYRRCGRQYGKTSCNRTEIGDSDMSDQKQQDLEPGFIFQRVARQRLRLSDKRLAPHNLTSAQVFLLNWLLHKDGMTQKELAERLSIGTVAVSGMVDRLEAMGLVYRGEDPNDRRAKKVWLKDAVRTNRELLSEVAKEINDVSFKGMSADEIKTLLGLMDRMRRNLSEALDADDVSEWINQQPIRR
ncbi:MarR family transcriptional regulator [Aquicoccus porphyridii]|uniref:MarR family transcriptional regulator n=2 Tax=Aquicoccus porphyridii TaxID=1852029 RepID=A0A5A9YYT6_9RHOB|nr:MarR family transcriptional regulator [Aquicoccus porphyridii]RAI52102.1 hypothetical protein DOO74_19540 [Rhodobacteraceae bacterium AsT-22]